MHLKNGKLTIIIFLVFTLCPLAVSAERVIIDTCGKGYLESVDGYPVLHLKGTPEEMGTQYGTLMKEKITANVDYLLGKGFEKKIEIGKLNIPRNLIGSVLVNVFTEKIPEHYLIEMNAMAKAAGIPESKIKALNLIPELFHCSGFALLKQATVDNRLYHGRVLDYAVDWKLQQRKVIILAEPKGKIPFVNVGYAGFIGSVTGMNTEQISIGEMGGGGLGKWNGIPMAFLMRMVLEEADSLEKAVSVFTDNPRTCEYYYVIADAEKNDAVGMRAVPEEVEVIKSGQKHELLPLPVKNTVIMSAGKRYKHLSRKIKNNYGNFTVQKAIRLMDAPVAMKNNLQNTLMIPSEGLLYVAEADKDENPAWKQKYYKFDINELFRTRPKEN